MDSPCPRTTEAFELSCAYLLLGLAAGVVPIGLIAGLAAAGEAGGWLLLVVSFFFLAASTPSAESPPVQDLAQRPRVVEIRAHAATCSYCSTGFGGRAVACPSCETPHHGDCWRENDGCTVYACATAPARPRPQPRVTKG